MSKPSKDSDLTATVEPDAGEEGEGAAGPRISEASPPISKILDERSLNVDLDDPIDNATRAAEKHQLCKEHLGLDPNDAAARAISAGSTVSESWLDYVEDTKLGGGKPGNSERFLAKRVRILNTRPISGKWP